MAFDLIGQRYYTDHEVGATSRRGPTSTCPAWLAPVRCPDKRPRTRTGHGPGIENTLPRHWRATCFVSAPMSVATRLLELVFVPHCPACDCRLSGLIAGAGLCPACSESLYELGSACPRCAQPIDGPRALVCARCRRRPPPFRAAFAPYRYGGQLGVALRRLKYQSRPDIARALAPLLAPALHRVVEREQADVVVPMPLHWQRLSARTFNQSALLARYAGYHLECPIDTLSLRRIRATRAQSGANALQRIRNVAGAFAVVARRRDRVAGKRVLLFDDIMTTGATMAAATRALRAASAHLVIAFCAARAELE